MLQLILQCIKIGCKKKCSKSAQTKILLWKRTLVVPWLLILIFAWNWQKIHDENYCYCDQLLQISFYLLVSFKLHNDNIFPHLKKSFTVISIVTCNRFFTLYSDRKKLHSVLGINISLLAGPISSWNFLKL